MRDFLKKLLRKLKRLTIIYMNKVFKYIRKRLSKSKTT